MSNYIPPYYGYGGNFAKSVYVPQRQQESQLPSGVVPVIGLENAGLAGTRESQIGGYGQFANAGVGSTAELNQMGAANIQANEMGGLNVPSNVRVVPVFVDSDYATPGWGRPFHIAPSRVINAENNLAQAQTELANNEAEVAQARAQYESAIAQMSAASARLNQLGIQNAPSMTNLPQMTGAQRAPSMGNIHQAKTNSTPQVRFASNAGGRVTPANSDYRFPSESNVQTTRGRNQVMDSVYVGIPNNAHYAGNRSAGPFMYNAEVPQQTFNVIAPEAYASEMNVRTAVMPDSNSNLPTTGVITAKSFSRTNILGNSSSDYHFDGLRGLRTPENQTAIGTSM